MILLRSGSFLSRSFLVCKLRHAFDLPLLDSRGVAIQSVPKSEVLPTQEEKFVDVKSHQLANLIAPQGEARPGEVVRKRYMLTVKAGELPSLKPQRHFPCTWPGCEVRRGTAWSLVKHMKVHLEKFKCNLDGCSKCFESQNDLRRHIARHENLRLFACPVCDATFNVETELKGHFKTKHSNEKKPFKCPEAHCTASAWSRRNLCRHRVSVHQWNWRSEVSAPNI